VNRKRFSTESNVIYRNESNRLAKGVHTGGWAGGAALKKVTIQTHGHDKYKRILGDVILPDGTNVNQELVKQGWCWWYRKYAPGDITLDRLEVEVRTAKRGLWQDPQPVPQWVLRKARVPTR
jgi:endonuclease YncB( thermonuclease family)